MCVYRLIKLICRLNLSFASEKFFSPQDFKLGLFRNDKVPRLNYIWFRRSSGSFCLPIISGVAKGPVHTDTAKEGVVSKSCDRVINQPIFLEFGKRL